MSKLVPKFGKLIADNSPVILTAVGVTGTVATALLTGRAAFRVGLDANAGHYEPLMAGEEPESMEPKDLIKKYWKEFIPAVAVGTLTVVCIIGANRIGSRRAAALAAAYSLTEKAFDDYKAKVYEHVGRQKEEKIRDEIAQDRVNANPVSSREIIITGNGDVLCYDSITGRYFMSNVESLRKAQNDLNHQIIHNLYVTLTEFFGLIGLPATPYSSEVGWNMDDMLDLGFSAVMSDDGRPCISIDYTVAPIRGYDTIL